MYTGNTPSASSARPTPARSSPPAPSSPSPQAVNRRQLQCQPNHLGRGIRLHFANRLLLGNRDLASSLHLCLSHLRTQLPLRRLLVSRVLRALRRLVCAVLAFWIRCLVRVLFELDHRCALALAPMWGPGAGLALAMVLGGLAVGVGAL
ncbi:hypothetical protein B0H12DRAFT_292547 [Mycena haematopus]|nr:hypothetical protein B0H12DRAFT_292547 [Mycena haematopus]